MVQYSLDECDEDMVLARPIVLSTGELLLAAGHKLTTRYIQQLKKLGITSVFIQVEGTEDIFPKSIISTQIDREISAGLVKSTKNLQSILKMKVYSKEKMYKIIKDKKNQINDFINSSGFLTSLNKVIDEILAQPAVVVNLASLQKKDAFLFEHALRVTILSLCIAKRYRFTREEMTQLAIGAINYDIGLLGVPVEIIKKTTPITLEEKER